MVTCNKTIESGSVSAVGDSVVAYIVVGTILKKMWFLIVIVL